MCGKLDMYDARQDERERGWLWDICGEEIGLTFVVTQVMMLRKDREREGMRDTHERGMEHLIGRRLTPCDRICDRKSLKVW